MQITSFGAGFVGSALAAELARRGHGLTVVTRRPWSPPAAGVTHVVGDVHDAETVAAATGQADVVVSALPPLDRAGGLAASTAVLAAAAGRAGARLGVVGSSAILPVRPGGPRHADTPGFPPFLADRVDAHDRTLRLLGEAPADLDWFYLAAAGEFGPFAPGERTGRYRTSTVAQVHDRAGRSRIGVEDYAVAFADEIEHPTVHRGWLTVGY